MKMNRRSFLLGTVSALAVVPLSVVLPNVSMAVAQGGAETDMGLDYDRLVWNVATRAFVGFDRDELHRRPDGPVVKTEWAKAATKPFSGEDHLGWRWRDEPPEGFPEYGPVAIAKLRLAGNKDVEPSVAIVDLGGAPE